jgi:hypothetical protein
VKRDLRAFAKQTNVRLAVGAILTLLIVGGGLIWLIYGPGAASFGLICVLAGLTPVLLIVLVFWVIDRILQNARPK